MCGRKGAAGDLHDEVSVWGAPRDSSQTEVHDSKGHMPAVSLNGDYLKGLWMPVFSCTHM